MTLLKFTVQVVPGNNYVVLNLPTALSIQNRKLHRACLEYQVNGGYIYDSNNQARIKFGALPDTWPVRAAIKRARNHWLTMHKEIFQNNPSLKPKWHDFKPMMSAEQADGGSYTTYNVPEDIFDDNVQNNVDQGHTWSKYTTENSNHPVVAPTEFPINPANREEFTCHILGDHLQTSAVIPGNNTLVTTTSVGALESWINSRPDLNPINTISDSELDEIQMDPLNMLFNDGGADDEILENFNNAVDGDGDQEGDAYPPYHLTRPIDTIMEVAAASVTSAATTQYFTGFKALLGQVFLKIDAFVDVTDSPTGLVDIVLDVDPRGMTI